MSDELTKALNQLRKVLESEAQDDCVAVSVFFNAEGHEIEYRTRTNESLKRDGISMRNLRGDFIKG